MSTGIGCTQHLDSCADALKGNSTRTCLSMVTLHALGVQRNLGLDSWKRGSLLHAAQSWVVAYVRNVSEWLFGAPASSSARKASSIGQSTEHIPVLF